MTLCFGLRRQTALSNACKARSAVIRDCIDQPTTRLENRSINRPVHRPIQSGPQRFSTYHEMCDANSGTKGSGFAFRHSTIVVISVSTKDCVYRSVSHFLSSSRDNPLMTNNFIWENGAVEKTRTSTGVTPQRPQRCASTNSATTARSLVVGRVLAHAIGDVKGQFTLFQRSSEKSQRSTWPLSVAQSLTGPHGQRDRAVRTGRIAIEVAGNLRWIVASLGQTHGRASGYRRLRQPAMARASKAPGDTQPNRSPKRKDDRRWSHGLLQPGLSPIPTP